MTHFMNLRNGIGDLIYLQEIVYRRGLSHWLTGNTGVQASEIIPAIACGPSILSLHLSPSPPEVSNRFPLWPGSRSWVKSLHNLTSLFLGPEVGLVTLELEGETNFLLLSSMQNSEQLDSLLCIPKVPHGPKFTQLSR